MKSEPENINRRNTSHKSLCKQLFQLFPCNRKYKKNAYPGCNKRPRKPSKNNFFYDDVKCPRNDSQGRDKKKEENNVKTCVNQSKGRDDYKSVMFLGASKSHSQRENYLQLLGMEPNDYLNHFSSVFIRNIKSPIPKDPCTLPKMFNVYVPPKRTRPFAERFPQMTDVRSILHTIHKNNFRQNHSGCNKTESKLNLSQEDSFTSIIDEKHSRLENKTSIDFSDKHVCSSDNFDKNTLKGITYNDVTESSSNETCSSLSSGYQINSSSSTSYSNSEVNEKDTSFKKLKMYLDHLVKWNSEKYLKIRYRSRTFIDKDSSSRTNWIMESSRDLDCAMDSSSDTSGLSESTGSESNSKNTLRRSSLNDYKTEKYYFCDSLPSKKQKTASVENFNKPSKIIYSVGTFLH